MQYKNKSMGIMCKGGMNINMIINKNIISEYNLNHNFINNIFEDSAYIDIETTGLSSAINSIISLTILLKEEKNNTIYQLFSSSDEEEKELIKFFVDLIKLKKFIITYNGKSFDLTFLNSKINKYSIEFDLNTLISIDLYKDMKSIKEKINIDNIRLKTVESFFGIIRNDELSGKDIIKLYDSYKIHKKKEHMDLILTHNYEDVLYLPIIFDNILMSYDRLLTSNYLGLLKINNKNITINNKVIKIQSTNITDYNLDYVCNKSTYKLVYKKYNTTTKIDLFTSYYSDNRGNYIIYIPNDELYLQSFNTINNLRPNIIPLVINDSILYENLYLIIEKIISCI